MTPGDLEEMVYSTRRRVSFLEDEIEELKAEIKKLKGKDRKEVKKNAKK